jgi:hypothetical protein
MTNTSFCNVTDKSSANDVEYSLCDICAFNGCPNERVVFVIHGFRHENEDGFVLKFTEYDFPIRKGKVHTHKFNES